MIYTILLNEKAKMNHSCVYFSIIGAYILHEHYKIDAKVSMGTASYLLDKEKMNVLAFAEKNGDNFICTENGFHAWIEANNFIIDLTAPLFPKMIRSIDPTAHCKPKMFQKPLNEMCESGLDLKSDGDFYHGRDMVFSDGMVDHFMSSPFNTDLVRICCNWYKKPPQKILKTIKIGDNHGNINDLNFQSYKITGSW